MENNKKELPKIRIVELTTTHQVRREMAKIYTLRKMGEIDSQMCRDCIYCLRHISDMLQLQKADRAFLKTDDKKIVEVTFGNYQRTANS